MKLQSKKARVPIAALGVTALVCGAGALVSPAYAAPTALTLTSGATTPAVGNFGYASTAAANAAYALKLSGADEAVKLSLESAPTSGALAYNKVASNGAATTSFTTVSTAGVVADEAQLVTISGTPTGGTFTLTFDGQTTGAIAYNAVAATVETALEALSNLAPADVTVGGGPGPGTPYTVTFSGAYASSDVPQMVGDGTLLTGGTAPAATVTTTTQGSSSAVSPIGTPVASDYIYLTGNVPGTYTFRFFQDTNGTDTYEAADERASALITLTVYDAFGTPTASTADDVAPAIAADSPTTVGLPVVAGITYSKAISTTDARGDGATGLAARLAALVKLDKTAGTTGVGAATDASVVYSATTLKTTYAVGTPSAAGTLTLRGDFTDGGSPDPVRFGSKSVVVNSNSVTDLTLAATDVVGAVLQSGATVAVKPGTAAVTYTATAINDQGTGPTTDDTPVSGALVYFTLAGDNLADLTTDGTAVTGQPNVYSSSTNASGVASLKVTSAATADTDSYTVDADSNAVGATLLTTTYESVAADEIEVTSTDVELTPEATAGVSVALKGKITDNFGAAYVPTGSASTQAQVFLGTAGSSCGVSPVTAGVTATNTAAAVATISGGAFSSTYTPVVTPTAGFCQAFTLVYDTNNNGTVNVGEFVDGTINYASTTAAGTVTLTTPRVTVTGANLSDSSTIDPGQANGSTGATGGADTDDFGDNNGQVVGTVLGTDNAPLAFKAVTITGGDGVYFSTAASPGTDAEDDLQTSITVVTDNAGAFDGAYAFFTKVGTVMVTAKAGTVSDEASVTTDDSNEPYFVTVNDVSGAPGSTLIVTGTIKDAFLNLVPNATVNLSIGTSTLGAFGDSSPQTNAAGVFSTTFTSGSNQSGVADLVATLPGWTANPTAATAWLTDAGITVAHGEYRDQAALTISATDLTLVAQAKVIASYYGAKTLLSGTFLPNTSIDIYAKASGATSYQFIDTAMTDAEGEWGSSQIIKKSTYFLARSSGLSSLSDQTQVFSRVGTITAKALGGGKVSLYANGDPNAKAPMVFYRAVAGVDPKLKGIITNSYGSARVTVKLPKGTRYVYATFQAAGTGKGISKRIAIKVK